MNTGICIAQNKQSKSLSTLSQKSATVAEFRHCLAVFDDSRTFVRQSHFSATVWTGLKMSPKALSSVHTVAEK